MVESVPSKKLLFISNAEYGQASIHCSIIKDLLSRSDQALEIHLLSFPFLQSRVSDLVDASNKNSLQFHPILSAPSYLQKQEEKGALSGFIRHGTGFLSSIASYMTIGQALLPWTGDEYLKLYHEMSKVIEEVKPDLAMVDVLFAPAIDACLGTGQKHIILSPTPFKGDQGGKNFNLPACSSGYPYPLPLMVKPLNYILLITLTFCFMFGGVYQMLKRVRKENGMTHPLPSIVDPKKELVISASAPECDYPFEPNPALSLPVGPIVQPIQDLEKVDPELLAWISKRPTILLALGSHVHTTQKMSLELSLGFKKVLEKRRDVQVLWKVRKPHGDEGFDPLEDIKRILGKELKDERVKIVDWLKADPVSILATGHVICSVNHGGANSFFESIYTGVPQVVLACWFDTMDNAAKVEFLKVGTFGNRRAAPDAECEEFSRNLLKVIGDGTAQGDLDTAQIKRRAIEVGEASRKRGGARAAGDKIMEMAMEG